MTTYLFLVVVLSFWKLCLGSEPVGLLIPSTNVPGLPSNASVFGAFSQALANASVLHFEVSKNTRCVEGTALNEAFQIKDRVHSFIGPVCEKGELTV